MRFVIAAALAFVAGQAAASTYTNQDGSISPDVVIVGAPGAACDATITIGGSAQILCGGVIPMHGWAVYNPNATDDLWCSDTTTAAINGAGSIRIVANGGGYETPAGYRPSGPVSCVGATTGDKITGRRW